MFSLQGSASFISPYNKYLNQNTAELNHSDLIHDCIFRNTLKLYLQLFPSLKIETQNTKTDMERTYRFLLDICFVTPLWAHCTFISYCVLCGECCDRFLTSLVPVTVSLSYLLAYFFYCTVRVTPLIAFLSWLCLLEDSGITLEFNFLVFLLFSCLTLYLSL